MNKKSGSSKAAADKLVKNIRRKAPQTYSAEEKIRIVLAGLRGEESIHLPTKQTLDMLSIPRATFYRPLPPLSVIAGNRREGRRKETAV